MKENYILYLDKPNKFECKIALEGASLRNSFARVLLESSNRPTISFNGTINESGVCHINMTGLKDYFKDSERGQMKLEVVADDAYFQPWASPFDIRLNKKLTVEVVSESNDTKKSLVVEVMSPQKTEEAKLVESLVAQLGRRGITARNVLGGSKKKVFNAILKDAVQNAKYSHDRSVLIEQIIPKLV